MKSPYDRCVVSSIVLAHRFVSPKGWAGDEYRTGRVRHGLILVLEGRALYDFGGDRSFVTEAGELLYMSPETVYVPRCLPEEPFVHMTVNFLLAEGGTLDLLPMRMRPENPAKIEELFTRLITAWTRRRPYYQLECAAHLYELIHAAHREATREHDVYRQKLRPAIAYMDAHACEALPEEGLAGLCGLSETYFRRLFRRVYKESPLRYRTRLRMGQACDLLLSGRYTVEEVARMTGYEDAAYFSRVFKQALGESPSQYLKSR